MHNHSYKHFLLVFSLFLCLILPRLAARGAEEQPMEQQQLRIVSLSPNVTETIFALDAGELLVGRSDYCNYPETATTLPSVGTLYNPSLEMLLSLEPNLVISSAFVPEQFLDAVKKAGIDVLTLETQQDFQGTYTLIREIARRTGKDAEAELMILSMQNVVRNVVLKTQQSAKPTVYVALDFGSFDSSATKGTFLSEMVSLAGGINIADDAQNWTYSKELLMSHDPQVILLSPRWGETGEQTLKEFTTTKPYADLSGTIRIFDADLISRQGPRSAQALEELYNLIHQEQMQ
ncbi:ABC transporter substrate-binding protein [Sphaerochaeta associata]|uniref:ABC transporter substrate-binding protein n=1 Tax=Sphaerochaeta associata TaxID=1129264 RepID=A0ABY4DG05_9SPIR|nr:ABC transporter substrate-binding protein [Sphaerochaeta associata]UOM52732.1 ABC transporter substrate-binding protein [Sphaerochaeta associata]